MKTKVAEDLQRSPDTHAYTQHRQVNTWWQYIHVCHNSKFIKFFKNKLFIGTVMHINQTKAHTSYFIQYHYKITV